MLFDRARIEERLRERAEELRKGREARRREAEGMRGAELADIDQHLGDYGSDMLEQEIDLTSEVIYDEDERRIAEARRALDQGTYGRCVDCGIAIAPERLRVVPEAVRCIDCQRHFEGLHRQANVRPPI